MKTLLILLSLLSTGAFASTQVECVAGSYTFYVQNTFQNELRISFMGEEVLADGLLDKTEVDLVAKFKSIGEMTLFAKVGKKIPENYVFLQGRKFSVFCR